MVDNKYGIAYSQVLEILKHIPVEDYNKIPKSEIELFETYADNDYIFNYDVSKTLKEQEVLDITKGIIILLFRDYWATEKQRNKIIAKQNYDRIKLEEEKMRKYNNDIFKNKNNISNKIEPKNNEEVQLVEYKESIFNKFINFIKKFLKNKK